jgi:protein-tyrosine-phosphatase/8-oxo-dGTP pyrophosphatase MutT (NUDIX family)
MTKTDTQYKVHFVCRGNTFRSRLAAAYFNTLVGGRFSVTSSGIDVLVSTSGIRTTEPYTKAIARAHHLRHGIITHKTQTTEKLLRDADVIVSMNKDVYDDALKEYRFDIRKSLVWHVSDLSDSRKANVLAEHSDTALAGAIAGTFRKIQHLCDDLSVYLTHTAWVDVVDIKNEPIGLRLPIAWVTDRGLWHRGIHVVAQTVDGKYVVGKRTNDIVFAPGMLEISLGGGVDSGENPLKAAARETCEELGVRVAEKQFRPLFMYKQVGYHPHYNKQTRCHLYVYAVRLPVHSNALRPEPGEVAELRAVSRRQIKHLLHAHRMQHFGRLKWGYKLYDKAVAYSTVPL